MAKDSMTTTGRRVKQITLRWPVPLWKRVSRLAVDRESSVQAICTDAVMEYIAALKGEKVGSEEKQS